MPVYDYSCTGCGDFTVFRPMSEFDQPHPCPGCGASGERAILTMPSLATMEASRRTAISTNERSSHAPRRGQKGHGGNCACCTGPGTGRTFRAKDGSKSFPKSRPWMISH